uniref:Uncharacterized protein n=1 Tax=Arundo donax TaxID=35708 RepID=A0A0A8YSA4_ARUDO
MYYDLFLTCSLCLACLLLEW